MEAPAVVETPAVVKPETPEFQMYDVMSNSSKRIEVCIKIPAEEHPNVNFVGRLIGPGGATLKAIQEMTSTRIAILGKGSQRDKKKVLMERRCIFIFINLIHSYTQLFRNITINP